MNCPSPWIVRQAKIASYDMFDKSDSLRFSKLYNHIIQNGCNSVESFIGLTYVDQTSIVHKDLLHDEYGYSSRQLASVLHDP
jgi:hypothetical protein